MRKITDPPQQKTEEAQGHHDVRNRNIGWMRESKYGNRTSEKSPVLTGLHRVTLTDLQRQHHWPWIGTI